jgi:hypothetical protein
MKLITKGPLATPKAVILGGEIPRVWWMPYTGQGYNLPQPIKSLKGLPRIPIYQSAGEWERDNPKPY